MKKLVTEFFQATFGSLRVGYLFRHYFFGGLFIFVFFYLIVGKQTGDFSQMPFLIFSLILYPFSSFVYESIMGTLMGNNVFVLPTVLILIWAVIKTGLLLGFSIFIAPIGMIYLYFQWKKNVQSVELEEE